VTQVLGKRISSIDMALHYLLADENLLFSSTDPSVQSYLRKNPEFQPRLIRWRNDEPASYAPDKILTDLGLMNLGGMDDDTVLLTGLKGFCLESRLPEGPDKNPKLLKTVRRKFYGRDKSMDAWMSGPIGTVPGATARVAARTFRDYVDAKCSRGPGRIKPAKPLIPGAKYVAGDLVEFNEMVDEGSLDPVQARNEIFAAVDRKLDEGSAVSIGYDVNEILSESVKLPRRAQSEEEDGDHSSVIAARKMINGKCSYYLRIHYGPGCDYIPSLQPKCEPQDGGVWITKEDIRAVYAAVWIEK
jgi:hypothetical protein